MKIDTVIDDRKMRARAWFEGLRDRICASLEELERDAPASLFPLPAKAFELRPWARENGLGGGVGGFLQNGRLFEKAVSAPCSPSADC